MARRFLTRPTLALVGFLWSGALLAAPPSNSLSGPSSLTATGVSTSQIQLAWDDPNASENGYQIERSPNGVTGFVLVATVAKNVTAYVSSGLSPATTYFHRVRATGKQNSVSPYSPVAGASTLTPPPPPTPTPTAPPPPPTATPTPAPPPPTATQTPVPPPPTATPTPAPPPPTATQTPVPPPPTATPTPAPPPPTATPTPAPPPPTATPTPAPPPPTATPTPAPPPPTATPTPAPPPPTATPTPAPPPPTATPTPLPAPSAPTGLSASAASSSQINLSWSDTSGSESGFKIERSTATSGWAQIGTTPANVTGYASSGLGAGTTYSYRVRAYNGSGDSLYSNTASATTAGGTGASAWAKTHGDVADDRSQGVAVDSTGGSALTGHLDGVADFGGGQVSSFVHPSMGPTLDVVVASYTASGAYRWARVMGSDSNEEGKGISIDDNDNVLVTGYQGSFAVDYGGGPQYVRAGTDIFVAKYSSAGSWVWSKTMGGSGADQGNAVAADGAGNVFLTGYMGVSSTGVNLGGTALFSAGMADAFLAKYSATGAHLWSKRLGSTGNDVGLAVGTDASGNVLVGGTFSGTVDFGGGPLTSAGMRDLFLAKYDAAGGFLWAQRFGGTGDDVLNDLAVDSLGDVAIAGKFQASINLGGVTLVSVGGDDAVAAKFSGATGGHLWSKRFGAASGDIATGVAIDGANNVVVAGYFSGSVDFGGGALASLGVDVFVAKYSPSGAHLSSKKFGGADTQICDGVGAASDGAITLAGFFMGTIDFGTGLKTAAGGFDGFLAWVGP